MMADFHPALILQAGAKSGILRDGALFDVWMRILHSGEMSHPTSVGPSEVTVIYDGKIL